jgi:hypothetical protein
MTVAGDGLILQKQTDKRRSCVKWEASVAIKSDMFGQFILGAKHKI